MNGRLADDTSRRCLHDGGMTTTREAQRPEVDQPSNERTVTVNQLSRRGILAVWAAAALPMGALAWIVAPAVAAGGGPGALSKALVLLLTAGLVWQFVLVVALVGYEQRSLRWYRVREALWLRSPKSPRTGKTGGRIWLLVIPLSLAFGLEELISLPGPASRNMGEFLSTDTARAMFHGSWGWFAVIVVMVLCNTVVGEELLFRGFLLPRMHGAFGNRDWVVNGILFAAYHLPMPWIIPTTMLDALILSYPSKRFRSAWMGIAVHSVQSVFVLIAVLALVV